MSSSASDPGLGRERVPGSSGVGAVVEVRILSGARTGEQMYFFDAPKVRLGRNLASDVVLPDAGVSRHHAELVRQGPAYILRDVGSTAGTYVLPSGERLGEVVIDPTAAAGSDPKAGSAESVAAKKAARTAAAPNFADVSIGQIGHGPRCRIGVGLSVAFGRYILSGRLGGGGMAEVFMARQTGLGGMFRQVALKLIQPEMWSLIDAGAMFLDEARIAADINHHNVVKIYDVGEHDGVLFLAMEYLRGVTVSNLANQLAQRGERLPPELVAALIGQACAGLHAAHQLRDMSGRLQNVVHRDVSPSNLMVLPEGLVKVIDFGVARADTRLNKAEEGLQGKPAYMSPEQVQAQPLDCRSDVFALGVVLYELCSGQPLFYREDTVATFYAVVRGEVPPLRSVCPTASPRLEAIVRRALAKQPDQRFQSAAELGAELDQVVAEAGGRFSSIAAISRFLTERGVSLAGTPPALLTQIPKAMYADSGRVRKTTPRELFEHAKESARSPTADANVSTTGGAVAAPSSLSGPPPSAAPSGDALRPLPSPRPAAAPPLSRPPLSRPPPASASGAHSAAASRRALAGEPQRLIGMVLDGRYRLQSYLGRSPKTGRVLTKLPYLATIVTDGPAELQGRAAGRLRGNQVVVTVCGRGDSLQPLDPAQQVRLQRFAAARHLPTVPAPLLPVLHCGQLPAREEPDADGSGASYIVQPQVETTLLTYAEKTVLSVEDRLELARSLCRTLAHVVQHEPGFVHGDLKPYHIGLWPPPPPGALALHPAAQLVLLNFCLTTVLGDTAPREVALAAGLGSPYLAPERWAGGPPSAAADMFALAAILYELLGGELIRAAQCARNRREIPPLPPQPGLLPHVELAILSALRADPAQRPDAARLAALLASPGTLGASPNAAATMDSEPETLSPSQDGGISAGAKDGLLHVPLPAPGEPHKVTTPSGRHVVLLAMTVPAGREHASLPLPLSPIPNLLPAPLLLIAHGESLMIELDGTPLGRGRDRPSLYHDAQLPSSRCERYTLKPVAEAAFFDVGHRRLSVQRLHYSSVVSVKTPGPLSVALPELQLALHAPGALKRLVVLHTEQQGLTYALCIAVG